MRAQSRGKRRLSFIEASSAYPASARHWTPGAAYQGDPAATSAGETIFCYPSHPDHDPLPHRARAVPARRCRSSRASSREMAHARHRHRHPSRRVRRRRRSSSTTAPAWSLGKRASSAADAACIRGLRSARCPSPRASRRRAHQGHPPPSEAGGRRDRVRRARPSSATSPSGQGSVIGANTWVTRDVPRNSKVVSGD